MDSFSNWDQFPDYSDLGKVTSATRSTWEAEYSRRAKFRYYYDGAVFEDRVPTEESADPDAPKLYPVGINLVKMLCQAMADSTFGEWEEDIMRFDPAPRYRRFPRMISRPPI